MKKKLLINQISLMVATLFLIGAAFTKDIYLILIGLVMIGYSSSRIKKIKENKE